MTSLTSRVETAIDAIRATGDTITITAVARHAGLSRTTLYRHPELITLIHEHATTRHANTLDDLRADIAHLTAGIEAIAARVRQHEERLRHLERHRKTGTHD